MKSKSTRRKKKPSAPSPSFFGGLVRSLLGLFEEELPVSKYAGKGKFTYEVAKVGDHQAALEAINGGRAAKAAKVRFPALIVPQKGPEMRVMIDGRLVGELMPKDAKALKSLQASAHPEPFILEVPALLSGGARKKNGTEELFAVSVDLPLVVKPKSPARSKKQSPGE